MDDAVDLIADININATRRWMNGKCGHFIDFDNNCLFRFAELTSDFHSYIHTLEEQKIQPVLTYGFVGFLIKQWRNDIESTIEHYYNYRLNEYEKIHKNSPTGDLINIQQNFLKQHKINEQEWMKQSEPINDFLDSNSINLITGYKACYLRFVQNMEKKYNLGTTILQLQTNLTDDQRSSLFDLLIEGNFIPFNTDKDGFLWAFGDTNGECTSFKTTWLVDAVFLTDLLREIKSDEIILEEMKNRAKSFFVNKKGEKVRIDSYKKKQAHPNYKKLMKIINNVVSSVPE